MRPRCRRQRSWLLHEVGFRTTVDGSGFDRRADLIAVYPDHVHTVEIKGPVDTLAKLPEQLQCYSRVASLVDVAVSGKHLRAASSLLDDGADYNHVGLIEVYWDGRLRLRVRRHRPALPSPVACCDCLSIPWNAELAIIGRERLERYRADGHAGAARLLNDLLWAPVRQVAENCLRDDRQGRACHQFRYAWLRQNRGLANMGIRYREEIFYDDRFLEGGEQGYWATRRQFAERWRQEHYRQARIRCEIEELPLWTWAERAYPERLLPSDHVIETEFAQYWKQERQRRWWLDDEYMRGRRPADKRRRQRPRRVSAHPNATKLYSQDQVERITEGMAPGDKVLATLTDDEIERLARVHGCEPTAEALFAAVFTNRLLGRPLPELSTQQEQLI